VSQKGSHVSGPHRGTIVSACLPSRGEDACPRHPWLPVASEDDDPEAPL
jgi:hypothetical protein